MTERTGSSFTARSNGGKKFSRRVRSAIWAGPTLVPFSGWPWPVMCLRVTNTLSLASGRVLPWKPRIAARPISAHRCGSSP